jgi:outer membrane protein
MTKLFARFLILIGCTLAVASADEKARPLTLKQAHETALEKHPRITVAKLKALAAKQVTKQAASAFLPTISGNVGATAAADPNTRIVSGSLPMSSVFDRASLSVNVTQLITDFGRSSNLEQSSRLKAGADEQNIQATRAQVLLQVDAAYFGALQSKALVDVADQTVKTRQLLRDQTVTLAENKLKSDLDASFAEVSLQEALLLQSKSQNDLQSGYATLAALLDDRDATTYELADSHFNEGVEAGGASELISRALNNRPDLKRLRLERDSALKFAQAERGLRNPTLSLQGAAGTLPYREKSLDNNQNYAAGGIVLNVPIFTGGLYSARQKEAELKAQAATATLKDEEINVARDVRIAWINLTNARARTAITASLLEQARKTEALAEARYNSGTTSMVELGQAQLNITTAEINDTNARYELLLRRSILDYQIGNLR